MISKKLVILSILLFSMLLSFEFQNISGNSIFVSFIKKYSENEFYHKDNSKCNELDPIFVMGQRFKRNPINFCKGNNSQHICFQSSKFNYYNKLYRFPYGVICLMKNVVIDPSKSLQSNLTYKGPIDKLTRGFPILFKEFFNINCENNFVRENYSKLYVNYFNSWNYNYNDESINIEELSKGKTVFFISRNEDSPNIFHGFSEIVNCLSIMYILDLKPEDIQIVFLESMNLDKEPLYDLYTNIISRGNKPIYIRDLDYK